VPDNVRGAGNAPAGELVRSLFYGDVTIEFLAGGALGMESLRGGGAGDDRLLVLPVTMERSRDSDSRPSAVAFCLQSAIAGASNLSALNGDDPDEDPESDSESETEPSPFYESLPWPVLLGCTSMLEA